MLRRFFEFYCLSLLIWMENHRVAANIYLNKNLDFLKRRGVGRVSFLISFMFSILKTIELPTLVVVWQCLHENIQKNCSQVFC